MKYLLAFLLVAIASTAAMPDLRAPGAGELKVTEGQGRVVVSSRWWSLGFDLANGGTLDRIVFPYASGDNVLVRPFRTYIDQWSDADSPHTEFSRSQEGNMVRLEFTGTLGAAGRVQGQVTHRTIWTITPLTVRVDHTLRLAADLSASTVGIGCTAVRGDLNEFGLRTGPPDAPEGSKTIGASYGKVTRSGAVFIDEHHAPLYLLFFKRNVEGFDINTASDLTAWESALARRPGAGRYQARASSDGKTIEVIREPLAALSPVTLRKGEYTFSYYLGLPRLVEKSNRNYRHISFGNHPWPSDDLISRWAKNGVNIARLHNDYNADENFWHDGVWPPYDEQGMAEMRRVIATCHLHGIRVVPYFSIHEFHPKAQGYAENAEKWARTVDGRGTVIHNRTGKGEFGAQMCLETGWLARRKTDVEKAYRELGFDGIYYDWGASLPCNNREHNEKWHGGTDGMIDLLAWTRRLIAPQGTLILHLSGWFPSIAFENYGELIVNVEENSSSNAMPRLEDVALMTVLAESVPRSPCPSYRRDQPLQRNRNNIAQWVVMGLFPWSGQDGPVAEETFKLFRAFQPYRLEEYRLYNADSGAVRTGWPDVYGAVYGSSRRALVVVSNTSNEVRKRVLWTVKPGSLGFSPAAGIRVIDTGSGSTSTLPWSALQDGSLQTELGPYEYRLFEIVAQPAA
ncbi:MAG TPA: DUF6259 domain-containing protein [Bryobacteraceae bacterium]|nr:DUF6259 domain-containing protein [Bryobacteraceae bacterium]